MSRKPEWGNWRFQKSIVLDRKVLAILEEKRELASLREDVNKLIENQQGGRYGRTA
jgi:hypothetical protein